MFYVCTFDQLENEKLSLVKCEEEGERKRLAIDSRLAREQSDLEKYMTVNSTSESQLNKCRSEYRQRVRYYIVVLYNVIV